MGRSKRMPGEALTLRQQDVLGLIALGKSDAEIGEELGISERTVQDHKQEVYRVYGVSNLWHLARKLAEDGAQCLCCGHMKGDDQGAREDDAGPIGHPGGEERAR